MLFFKNEAYKTHDCIFYILRMTLFLITFPSSQMKLPGEIYFEVKYQRNTHTALSRGTGAFSHCRPWMLLFLFFFSCPLSFNQIFQPVRNISFPKFWSLHSLLIYSSPGIKSLYFPILMHVTSYKALQILHEISQGMFEVWIYWLKLLPHLWFVRHVAAETQTWLTLELSGELKKTHVPRSYAQRLSFNGSRMQSGCQEFLESSAGLSTLQPELRSSVLWGCCKVNADCPPGLTDHQQPGLFPQPRRWLLPGPLGKRWNNYQ